MSLTARARALRGVGQGLAATGQARGPDYPRSVWNLYPYFLNQRFILW